MLPFKLPFVVAAALALASCSKSPESMTDAEGGGVPEKSSSSLEPDGAASQEAQALDPGEVESIAEKDGPTAKPPQGEAAPKENRMESPGKAMIAELERTPLDLDRMLGGILEKYELDRLDDPKLQLLELLRRYEGGDRSVAIDLGILMAYGDPAIVDPGLATEILQQAAADGESRALSELGRLHLEGRGVAQDGAAARSYFEQAMERGDPEGAFLLGMGHRNGLWGEVDKEQGEVLIETAAKLGHVAAANSVWELIRAEGYAATKGLTKEERRTNFKSHLEGRPELEGWLLAGMDQGHIPSMLNLSSYYAGVGKAERAIPVLEAASELGSFTALSRLMDLSARRFRDDAFRESFRDLLLPHAEGDGSAAGEARFRLALLEATKRDPDLEEIQALLQESLDARHYKAYVAMKALEAGERPVKALITSKKMRKSDAYKEWTNDKTNRLNEAAAEAPASERPEQGRPVVKKMVQPKYPIGLDAESVSGEVVVEMLVNADGKVEQQRVVNSSHLAFEAPALEAVSQMEFDPASLSQEGKGTLLRLPIYFNPDE